MTKKEQIIKDAVNAMYLEMQDAMLLGYDYARYEQDYGKASVNIEVREVRLRNGFYTDDVDVWVSHDNTDHQSPLLEEAIRKALPNWWDVLKEVEARQTA